MRQPSLFPRNFRKTTISSLVLLATFAVQSQAADNTGQFQYTLSATAQYEAIENPNRFNGNINSDDVTENLAQGSISAQLSRQTSRFSTNLNYRYSYLDYRKDLLTDRALTTGGGSITYVPIRDTLFWDLTHNRNMRTIDASMPITQDNMQVVKTTSTGPRLTFNLGGKNRVATSYQYTQSATTFNTIYKQDRTTFDFSLMRQLTTTFSTGLAYNEFRTVSENNQLAQYNRKLASINNRYLSERYQLSLDVGHIETVNDLSSKYLNFDLTYVPVTDTTLQFTYQDTVDDLFSNLLYAPPGSLVDDGTPSLSTNVAQQYRVDRAGVTLSHQIAQALNYSLQYSTEDREFADLANNQSIDRLGLMINVPVNPQFTVSLFGRDSDLYFELTDRMQHRQEYGLSANWTLNRSFSMQFSVNHVKQKGGLQLDTYTGSNAMIAFTYTLSNN